MPDKPNTERPQRIELPDDERVEIQHGERCCEGTRRPIWLFEQRMYHVDWYAMSRHDDAAYDEDLGWHHKDTKRAFTVDEMVDIECAVSWWEAVTVFLSREEGEDFGRRKAHHFRDGWRVYCRGLGDYNSLAEYLDKVAVAETAAAMAPQDGLREALESLHWHYINNTVNREVMLGIIEDALANRKIKT